MSAAMAVAPRYPWTISNAVSLVDELPAFLSLPDSFTAVLRRLIKKVGKDDGQRPILARRQTLAEETGKSVETIYRALREFESKGWIEEREKRAGIGLKGSDSEITFTKALCDLLQLPYEGKRSATPKPPVTNDRSLKAIAISSLKQPSLKEQPAEPSKKQPQLSTTKPGDSDQREEETVVRIDGKSVPKELAWLVLDRGLPLTGLFALMKQARKHGKRLSDVVECVSQYLNKLEGRGLFAYLNKLVVLERDFAWDVRQRREAQDVESRQKADKDRLAKAAETLNGRWFVSRNSGAIFAIERAWVRMIAFDGLGLIRNSSMLMEAALLDAIEAGLVIPCEAGSTPVMPEIDE